MPYYRLYFLNGAHVDRVEEIFAEDDAEAVRRAESRQGSQALEMWCGDRKVVTLEARGSRARREAAR